MSKTFCCCIPVRVAVFFFSFLSFIFAGATAGLAWWVVFGAHPSSALSFALDGRAHLHAEIDNKQQVGNVNFGAVNDKGKIAFIVAGAISTFVCLVSLSG